MVEEGREVNLVDWQPSDMLEITLNEPDDFLKVKETLTRLCLWNIATGDEYSQKVYWDYVSKVEETCSQQDQQQEEVLPWSQQQSYYTSLISSLKSRNVQCYNNNNNQTLMMTFDQWLNQQDSIYNQSSIIKTIDLCEPNVCNSS